MNFQYEYRHRPICRRHRGPSETQNWGLDIFESIRKLSQGERRVRKHTCRNQNDHEDLRNAVDPPSALESILQYPESYQRKQRREADCRGERIGFRKGIPNQKQELFGGCLRIHDMHEFGQPKHGDELFAVMDINDMKTLVNQHGTHTMITTATAVIKPRRSARLNTTSMKPNLKTPSKKDIRPTWVGCSIGITSQNWWDWPVE